MQMRDCRCSHRRSKQGRRSLQPSHLLELPLLQQPVVGELGQLLCMEVGGSELLRVLSRKEGRMTENGWAEYQLRKPWLQSFEHPATCRHGSRWTKACTRGRTSLTRAISAACLTFSACSCVRSAATLAASAVRFLLTSASSSSCSSASPRRCQDTDTQRKAVEVQQLGPPRPPQQWQQHQQRQETASVCPSVCLSPTETERDRRAKGCSR